MYNNGLELSKEYPPLPTGPPCGNNNSTYYSILYYSRLAIHNIPINQLINQSIWRSAVSQIFKQKFSFCFYELEYIQEIHL